MERDLVLVLKVKRGGKEPEVEVRVPFKGFEPDDVLTGTTDPDDADHPFHVAVLKARPGASGEYDPYDFHKRMTQLAGRPAVVEVQREAHGPNEVVTSTTARVLVPPAFHQRLGLKVKMGDVAAVRAPATEKMKEGDVIRRQVAGGA